jgi:hypothetical protein
LDLSSKNLNSRGGEILRALIILWPPFGDAGSFFDSLAAGDLANNPAANSINRDSRRHGRACSLTIAEAVNMLAQIGLPSKKPI